MGTELASTAASSGALPGLMRNNSIDPMSLNIPRNGSRGGKRLSTKLADSVMTNGSGDSISSFSHDSVKFSAKNFVTQRTATLESTYRLGKLLGEGGFGEVYACTHKESGDKRAVKVMEKSTKKKSINEDIVKEYNILKELDHPKSVVVHS